MNDIDLLKAVIIAMTAGLFILCCIIAFCAKIIQRQACSIKSLHTIKVRLSAANSQLKSDRLLDSTVLLGLAAQLRALHTMVRDEVGNRDEIIERTYQLHQDTKGYLKP